MADTPITWGREGERCPKCDRPHNCANALYPQTESAFHVCADCRHEWDGRTRETHAPAPPKPSERCEHGGAVHLAKGANGSVYTVCDKCGDDIKISPQPSEELPDEECFACSGQCARCGRDFAAPALHPTVVEVLRAAETEWTRHRPVAWNEAEHLRNPVVNGCLAKLGRVVAVWIAANRPGLPKEK